jgi:protein-S-isoprenylcysteine O-methyltransferase Ste14
MMSTCPVAPHNVAWSILIGCWSVFMLVWAIGAVYNAIHSGKIERRGSSGWIVAVAVWAALVWAVPPSVWRPLVVCHVWVPWVGAAVLVVSTAFTLWARVALGAMWSSMPAKRAGHELRTRGPYSVTRHPIYTGLLGMLVGTGLIDHIGFWVVVVPFTAVMLIFKLRAEERLMRDAFGDAYVAYERQVPGLFPLPRR